MKGKTILIIEDEMHIRELIEFNLQKEQFNTISVESGEEGMDILSRKNVDLILLDIMLPGIDGVQVCNKVRHNIDIKNIPIIMLTAKSEITDKILGLEIGADDYISKPFDIKELIARIKSVLRRYITSNLNIKSVLEFNGILLNSNSREVSINGKNIDLTLKEYELLKLLMENKGKVLSRNFLLDQIWGFDYFGETRTVDVHIRHLRVKINDDDKKNLIETKRGVGYKFN